MKILLDLNIGDEVYFTDPDEGISSGYYEVVVVLSDESEQVNEDTIVIIKK